MKRNPAVSSWLFFALPDFLIVMSSFFVAYFIRHYDFLLSTSQVKSSPDISFQLLLSFTAGVLWCFFMARKIEYSHLATCEPARFDRALNIFSCGFKTLIFILALSAILRGHSFSRLSYLIGFILALVLMILWREVYRWKINHNPQYNILLVCSAENKESLEEMLNSRVLGIKKIIYHAWNESENDIISPLPILCQQNNIHTIIAFQEGMNPTNSEPEHVFFKLLNFCESESIAFYLIPDIPDTYSRREEMYSFTNLALIRLRDAFIHPLYSIFKRIIDISISIIILTIGLPLWATLAIIIKLEDGGTVFFSQWRVGLHGKKFKMHKFRTMKRFADDYIVKKIAAGEMDEEPVFNIRNDNRITKIGKILRRLSIDEIPQLVNVIKGDMSLVGPRPERKELVEKYSPLQRRRLKVLPGITGLQQVASRGDPSLSNRIKYDLLYMHKQSFWLDMYILLRTIFVVIRGTGVK